MRTVVHCVAEGENMPSTSDAVQHLETAGLPYAPEKSSNAGGMATSGLAMSQNARRLSWSATEVDAHTRRTPVVSTS